VKGEFIVYVSSLDLRVKLGDRIFLEIEGKFSFKKCFIFFFKKMFSKFPKRFVQQVRKIHEMG